MNLQIKYIALTSLFLITVLGFFAWQAFEISQEQINGILNIEVSALETVEVTQNAGAQITGLYVFSVVILVLAFWLTYRYLFRKPIEDILYSLKKGRKR